MKKYILVLGFLISAICFSQNNHIVKTEDGRRVLLKADYTWEYIDMEIPNQETALINTTNDAKSISELNKSTGCHIAADFVEPELNKKIQSQLKKGRATIDDVKKKVAKDYDCEVEDVVLLSVSEKKSNGVYDFCANGKKVSYKRTGHAILEKGKFF